MSNRSGTTVTSWLVENDLAAFKAAIGNEAEFVRTYNAAVESGGVLDMPELDEQSPKLRWHIAGVNTGDNLWDDDDFEEFYTQIGKRLNDEEPDNSYTALSR